MYLFKQLYKNYNSDDSIDVWENEKSCSSHPSAHSLGHTLMVVQFDKHRVYPQYWAHKARLGCQRRELLTSWVTCDECSSGQQVVAPLIEWSKDYGWSGQLRTLGEKRAQRCSGSNSNQGQTRMCCSLHS